MQAIWQNAGFARLTDQEKVLVLYYLTCEQANRIGLYQVKFQQVASEVGFDLDVTVEVSRSAWRKGKWEYDEVRTLLWIPSWWLWFPSVSDAAFRKALADFRKVVSSDLKAKFLAHTKHLPASQAAILGQLAAGVSLKKSVVVTNTDAGSDLFGNGTAATEEPSALAYQVVMAWNKIVTPPIPQVSRITNVMRAHIYDRLREFPNLTDWKLVFGMLNESEWFRGQGTATAYRDWVGDLSWLIAKEERFRSQLDKARVYRPAASVSSRPLGCRHEPACADRPSCTERNLREMGV